MDTVDEKSNMLSRAGSFYYRNLSREGIKQANKLCHIPCLSRAYQQLTNTLNATLSGGYFNDHHKVIRFKDDQVMYFGKEKSYQSRTTVLNGKTVRGNKPRLDVEDYFLGIASFGGELLEEGGSQNLLSEAESEKLYSETWNGEEDGITTVGEYKTEDIPTVDLPAVFPNEGSGEHTILEDNHPMFGLRIDKHILVHTIQFDDGKLMYRNKDFNSYYGLIIFSENPIKLFPKMKFMASSYTYRARNILCFQLGVSDVYGPVDRIVHYYRVSQSPMAFYYATCQAAGFTIVREDCKIASVVPLYRGWSYITTDGTRYDAPYPHAKLKRGEKLKKDHVIGGHDMFRVIVPEDETPEYIDGVYLLHSVPAPGLYAPNATSNLYTNGIFQPGVTGKNREFYLKYLRDQNITDPEGPAQGNVMKYMLNNVFKNRYIIIRINYETIPYDMLIRIQNFIYMEAPIGSVILEAPLQ